MEEKSNISIIEKIIHFFDHNAVMLMILLFELIFLFFSFEEDTGFTTSTLNCIVLIIITILLTILWNIKIFKQNIVFDNERIITNIKMFNKTIKQKEYFYDRIYKFIIAKRIKSKKINFYYYNIYVDIDNEIVKVAMVNTYKQCIGIISEIKNKANKTYYDMTDEIIFNEEDIFRNYYKRKNVIEEIKNEK